MQALYLTSLHSYPEYTTVPLPEPVPGETMVQLIAASLNRRDLYISRGKYAGIRLPVIPGSCGCGIVNNQRVLIQPGFNWGNSQSHQSADYHILGMPRNGTFAEWVQVPDHHLYPCPQHLTHEEAAALPLAGLTAYRALFTRGQLNQGQNVLISGIGGGVALMAMQFALAAGATVWVSSGSSGKIARAIDLGAAGGVVYKEQNWQKQLRSEAGLFDLVIDSAGGSQFQFFPGLCKPGGRIVTYGGTAGNIDQLSPQQIFWKQLSISGSTMGSPDEFAKMLSFVDKHAIRPVVDSVFSLEQGKKAYEIMDTSVQFGKIVLNINPM